MDIKLKLLIIFVIILLGIVSIFIVTYSDNETVTQAPLQVTQMPLQVTQMPLQVTQMPVKITQAPLQVTQMLTQAPVRVTTTTPPGYAVGRYVVIRRIDNKPEYINILKLSAYDYEGKFIKPTRATLYPIYDNNIFGPNSLVNENISNLIHTGNDPKAYIAIDLGKDMLIRSVKISNRLDCCKDRILGTRVEIINDAKQIVSTLEYKDIFDEIQSVTLSKGVLGTFDPFKQTEGFLGYYKNPSKNNLCMDDGGGNNPGETKMHLWTCAPNHINQQFIYDSNLKQLKSPGKNMCVDDGGGTREGETKMHLWTCDPNNKNQQFVYDANLKQFKNPNKNLCIDDGGGKNPGETKFHLWGCDPNNDNQKFDIYPVS